MPSRSAAFGQSGSSFNLSGDAWQRLEQVLTRFEGAWRAGQRPSVREFLAEAAAEERPALLVELVHEDLEFRLQAGEAARVEDYLHDYPELRAQPAALLELAAAEFVTRADRGEAVQLEDYRRRFPEFAAELDKAVAARRAWAGGGVPASEAMTLSPATLNPPPAATVSAAAPNPAPAGRLPAQLPATFGRYRIEKLLGRGGMGAVYLAHDTQLDRPVALKVPTLDGPSAEALRARFFREAQAAAVLHHPNLCPVHDVGEIGGVPYLTMAFLQGELLSRRLKAGFLPPSQAISLVRTVALALHEAHAAGVIHRDVKPSNIMIDVRGEPVVMDFGLARRAGLGEPLTQQGDVLGTPAYMSPEQVNGDVSAMGPASDIYSLGVVLYKLLAGTTPFRGDLVSLVSQISLDEPTPPSAHRPGLDARLDAVCLRALAKQPAARWPSMRAFADALAECLRPAAAAGPAPVLTLRIRGSSYAYRPAPGQDLITVGRQKRRRGDAPDHGNDLVVRVPGNDRLTAAISRRHLEIRRTAEGFAVLDCSKAGTLHNGRPLPANMPVTLAAGDVLVLAGVITLEVSLQSPAAPRAPAFPEVTQRAGGDLVVFEATVGDMITLD